MLSAERARPHVVIIGGGFGGLYAARTLRNAPVRITLIDRRNHHLFQPLLYQVATAALNPSDIARPIRRILRGQRNVTVILDEARKIDVSGRRVVLDDSEIDYDYLIVATGVTHAYFGHDEWALHAPGLKSIEDALDIRRRILLAYEEAEKEADDEARRALLTFAIVGGGPTGVELAGALAEISRHALAEDFRNIDPTQAGILLIEGLSRILPTFSPEMSDQAVRQLARLGVEVLTGKQVTEITADGVSIGGQFIPAKTVLWAAGVSASPLAQSLGVPLDRAGRVEVRDDLTIPGDEHVFVIGDLAAFVQDGNPVPGIAPAAMQEASHVADNIVRAIRGLPHNSFRFRNKGMLVAIGRAAAVADLPRIKLSGFVAWVAWLTIHIYFLIGFRNRLLVMFEWAWAYFTYERGARLITGR
jgi:NADH dehydrogenase